MPYNNLKYNNCCYAILCFVCVVNAGLHVFLTLVGYQAALLNTSHNNAALINAFHPTAAAVLMNAVHNAGVRRDGLDFVPVDHLTHIAPPYVQDVLYDPSHLPYFGVHPYVPNFRHLRLVVGLFVYNCLQKFFDFLINK